MAGVARSRSASWYARSRCTPPNPKPLAASPRSRPSVFEHQARHSSLCSSTVEPDVRISGIELERCQPERGEVRRLVDLDHGSRRLVHQLDGKQQVLSRRVEHRDVALEAGVDRAESIDRRGHRPDERRIAPRLRDSLEPHVALFAQPVERRGGEHDPVLGRRPGESLRNVIRRHRRMLATAPSP